MLISVNGKTMMGTDKTKHDYVPKTSNDPDFFTSNAFVTDRKIAYGSTPVSFSYNTVGPGNAFISSKQSFRFYTKDPCGKEKTYPCSTTYQIKFINQGNGNYSIEHQ